MTAASEPIGAKIAAVVTKQSRSRIPASRIGLHAIVIILMAIWLIPTIGLLINSFRPASDVAGSGWWRRDIRVHHPAARAISSMMPSPIKKPGPTARLSHGKHEHSSPRSAS